MGDFWPKLSSKYNCAVNTFPRAEWASARRICDVEILSVAQGCVCIVRVGVSGKQP